MHHTRKLMLAALVTTGLSACGGGGGGGGSSDDNVSYDASSVITNLADGVVVPTYQALNGKALELEAAIDALRDGDITEADLDAAQAAWKAARVPWESGEGFIFGPVDSLNIDPNLDSWPLDTTTLRNTVESNTDFTAAAVAGYGTDIQGFHTIEYLLFGDGTSTNEKTAAEMTVGEVDYLDALLDVFKGHTGTLVSAWTTQYNPGDSSTGPYADEIKLTGAGLYTGQAAVMEEFINGLIGIVDEVGNGKIADPFGTSIATADTTKVESQYSWNSLTDFHNNLQSVLNVYTGKMGYDPAVDSISTSLNGVYAFVNRHDSQLADRVLAEIVTAMDKIALIDGDGDAGTTNIDDPNTQMPFRNAIGDSAGRIRIQEAVDALATLQASLQNSVMPLVAKTDFGG